MTLALLNLLVALFLGFGAVQEFIIRGIRDGEAQPLMVGLSGIIVSLLFVISGLALWLRWPNTREMLMLTGALSVIFHVYAALPPHRNVRITALVVGAGYGLILLIVTLVSRGRRTQTA